MNKLKTILNLIVSPLRNQVFIYFFILGLCGNAMCLFMLHGWFLILSVIGLSSVWAYILCVISLLYKNLPFSNRIKTKPSHNPIFWIITIALNVLLLTDCFLYYNFKLILAQDIIDILADTTPKESAAFISTYLTFESILLWLTFIVTTNLIIYFISKLIAKHLPRVITLIGLMSMVLGIAIASYSIIKYIKYRNGKDIPQTTAITRVGYSYYIMRQASEEINEIATLTDRLSSSVTQGSGNNTIIVLVIGESHSTAHTSLYGYNKETYPRLKQLRDQDSLLAFTDVITIGDHTHTVMYSIFSLSRRKENFAKYPLFPSVFRAAGYKTILYDNQYLCGVGVSILGNERLSKQNFEIRNTQYYKYDGDMIDDLPEIDSRTLLICHLNGQHYIYSSKYPQSFDYFKPSEYNNKNDKQNAIIAQYDNASLYNDFVIHSLITKLKEKDAIIVYLSDHGEEVYEDGKSLGHGYAEASHNLDLQIKVPFLIWASETYRANNPGIWELLKMKQNIPICTDDISHVLVNLSGIETQWFDPTRSFFNEAYDSISHRITLQTIDYDAKRAIQ